MITPRTLTFMYILFRSRPERQNVNKKFIHGKLAYPIGEYLRKYSLSFRPC